MLDTIKNWLNQMNKSRLFPISVIFIGLFFLLVRQLFSLQIINGESYLKRGEYRNEKTRELKSTRGNIYDCNGELLAYDELSYSVTIEDTGELDSNEEKNSMIHNLIQIIEGCGGSIESNFCIELDENGKFQYTVDGNSLTRFKKDIYSLNTSDKLSNEQIAITAEELFDYIRYSTETGSPRFLIDEKYSDEDALKIMSIRYILFMNRYRSYTQATIATDVNDEIVAAIKENSADLPGVEILTETHRAYNNSKYFAHILGYTGTINSDEFDVLEEQGEAHKYTSTDQIGRTGLEKEYESYLHGEKGLETLVVNGSNRILSVKNRIEPTAGNNLYLTIDAELQEKCYNLLEQEIAGILLSNIVNSKSTGTKGSSAAGIKIPIYDVYYAFINNNVINIQKMETANASELERSVHDKFLTQQTTVLASLDTTLAWDYTQSNRASGAEMEEILDYIYSLLIESGVLISGSINRDDTIYIDYSNNKTSLSQFLQYALSSNWIDLTKLEIEDEFYSTQELYEKLVEYIKEALKTDKTFSKKLYYTLIDSYKLSGKEICLLLFEQGVLEYNETDVSKLKNGVVSPYYFIRDKIKNLEITPDQLALEPCSGSIVVTDPKTGEVKALVSYPGYDNNKMANSIDTEYYSYLQGNQSLPMINRPMQQRTAPGSTFKMVTSVAGLSEGVIGLNEQIYGKVVFDKADLNPRCWSSSPHGNIDVTDAIQVSCNIFFYEVGWRLSIDSNGSYNSTKGLNTLAKYASMFGLDSKSGIELPEYSPNISDKDSVRSSIGQGTNNYTPAQLARYVTTIANRGVCYDLTVIGKIADADGNVVLDNSANIHSTMDISDSIWNAVHSGMYKVVNGPKSSISYMFKVLGVNVAGKTGTAQESKSKPNHALFVSFAPYEEPELASVVVIPNGYTSSNAAEVARNIYNYYFNGTSIEEEDTDEIGSHTQSID